MFGDQLSFDMDEKAVAFHVLFKTIYKKNFMVATNMCDALWDQNNQNELCLLWSEMVTCVVFLASVVVEM